MEEYNKILLGQKGTGFDAWSYATSGVSIVSNISSGGFWFAGLGGDKPDLKFGKKNLEAFDEESVRVTENQMKDCDGVCGTIDFKTGEAGYSVVYLIANLMNTWEGTCGDISHWLGVCLEYISDVEVKLKVKLNSGYQKKVADDTPAYTIPAASKTTVVNIPWGLFAQGGWGGKEKIETKDALKNATGIDVVFYGQETATFSIAKLGAYGTCE